MSRSLDRAPCIGVLSPRYLTVARRATRTTYWSAVWSHFPPSGRSLGHPLAPLQQRHPPRDFSHCGGWRATVFRSSDCRAIKGWRESNGTTAACLVPVAGTNRPHAPKGICSPAVAVVLRLSRGADVAQRGSTSQMGLPR